ncbi:MAG: molybdopterin converting factor subunit 1 [Pseudomonadota bacterium]
MAVTVKYFASLRERLGRAEQRVEARAGVTAADVWAQANPGLPLPGNILVAVNRDYARLDHVVRDGDEVAFFPPVTGG